MVSRMMLAVAIVPLCLSRAPSSEAQQRDSEKSRTRTARDRLTKSADATANALTFEGIGRVVLIEDGTLILIPGETPRTHVKAFDLQWDEETREAAIAGETETFGISGLLDIQYDPKLETLHIRAVSTEDNDTLLETDYDLNPDGTKSESELLAYVRSVIAYMKNPGPDQAPKSDQANVGGVAVAGCSCSASQCSCNISCGPGEIAKCKCSEPNHCGCWCSNNKLS